MKRNFLSIIAGMILALITLASCDKEENFYTTIEGDTLIISVNINDTIVNNNHLHGGDNTVNGGDLDVRGDTTNIAIRVDGDSIVNHLHGGDTEVKGGDVHVNGGNTTTHVNGNNGGSGNSSEQAPIIIPEGYQVWKFTPQEFINAIYYNIASREQNGELATFYRVSPSSHEIPICFYDAGSDPTTLSFPFDIKKHGNLKRVWTDGKFGSNSDQTRQIYCLSLYNMVAEIQSCGNQASFDWTKLDGSYICGIAGDDGNSPETRTGRTLIGTNGYSIFLMVAESATTEEAYKTFVSLELCSSDQIMTVLGGSSSLGKKEVPIIVSVTNAIAL